MDGWMDVLTGKEGEHEGGQPRMLLWVERAKRRREAGGEERSSRLLSGEKERKS